MRDPDTGGQLTQVRLSDLLRNTYEAIRTNGLVDEADPGFYTTRKLANRHAEHRELVFKDGDAWMRYDRKYGTGNPFTAIMGHLRGLSQDIASLERFRSAERRVGKECGSPCWSWWSPLP